jgi:hypothetical protein
LKFDKNQRPIKIDLKGNKNEIYDKGFLEKMMGLNKKQIDSNKKI